MDDNEYDGWAVVDSQVDAGREDGVRLSADWRRMTVVSSVFRRIPALRFNFRHFSVFFGDQIFKPGCPGNVGGGRNGALEGGKNRRLGGWIGKFFFKGKTESGGGVRRPGWLSVWLEVVSVRKGTRLTGCLWRLGRARDVPTVTTKTLTFGHWFDISSSETKFDRGGRIMLSPKAATTQFR